MISTLHENESTSPTASCSVDMAIATLVALAQEADRREKWEHAEALLLRAQDMAAKSYGAQSVCVATILWELSHVLEMQGRVEEADELSVRVREILHIYKVNARRRN